ncbi:MAG TPA: low temperature requirement protein A [Rugosimonospora sp.]|jgi:low temperature requirement protein LtrA
MTHTDPATLVRSPGGSQRATLLELFFDLVYVAALALTSMNLSQNISWTGAIHFLLPLMALWWVWSITTLVTDFYNPDRLPIQGLIIGVMFGSILMAATLPAAFGEHGMIFAATYVAIHIGRGIYLLALLRHHLAGKRAARFFFWFTVSAIPWIVGAFMQGTLARGALWGAALLVDYVVAGFRYPTPWLGRVPLDQYDKAQEHVGERYQQFMILAFGDLILVAALRYNRTGLGAWHTVAFVATFATTVLLWQIYVYRAGSLLRNVPKGKPGRIVRWAPYTHFIMIAGIVASAAGSELAIIRPVGTHIPPGWIVALFGGPVLFLIGRTTFEYEVFDRFSWSRLAWLAVLIAVSPAMVLVRPAIAVVVVAAILLGVAVSDALRGRVHAPDPSGGHQHAVRRPGR